MGVQVELYRISGIKFAKEHPFLAWYVTIALKSVFCTTAGGHCRYPNAEVQTWAARTCGRAVATGKERT